MFRLLLSSLIFLTFTACTPPSSIIVSQTPPKEVLDESTIFKITIPVREHGYSNFKTQVLSSQNDFDNFIQKIQTQNSWNQKENFIHSLSLNPIDFKQYNLLLYRMTESSSSTILAVSAPQGSNKHVLIKIGRDTQNMGTSDMAYYALAYKVTKSVKTITFDNGSKKHVIKNEP